MRKNKFSILLSIMSFCLISSEPLRAQTSFHRMLKDVNENFIRSASVLLSKPEYASFDKNIFSDIYNYTDKSNSIGNFHFPTGRSRAVNHVLHLSGSRFKNEKFVNTGFSLPGNVARWWRLEINISYDWRLNKTNGNATFQFHISEYNLNASQRF
jgi:hypothetical protein